MVVDVADAADVDRDASVGETAAPERWIARSSVPR